MFLLTFFFWVLLNGKFTLEIAIFGVCIAGALYAAACRFAGYSVQKDLKIAAKLPMIILYIVVLIIEIIKANIVMAQYILTPQIAAEPALVRFNPHLKTQIAQVLLANSITLTPGTITVELKDGEYLVHCYDKSMGDGIDESVFVALLRKLED